MLTDISYIFLRGNCLLGFVGSPSRVYSEVYRLTTGQQFIFIFLFFQIIHGELSLPNPNPVLRGNDSNDEKGGLDDDITTTANRQADGFIRLGVNTVYLSTYPLPSHGKPTGEGHIVL